MNAAKPAWAKYSKQNHIVLFFFIIIISNIFNMLEQNQGCH